MPERRKLASWGVGVLLAWGLSVLLARDLGPSVRIRTLDAAGTHLPTKVWFVEDGVDVIVRGGADADWVKRLRTRPTGDLVYPGRREDFRAAFVPGEELPDIDARFRDRYGLLDWLDAPRRGGARVAVRLQPRIARSR